MSDRAERRAPVGGGVSLGIDGSNLRVGGGVTHLGAFLDAADPAAHGVERVTVWAGRATGRALPRKPWLRVAEEPMLDRPLPWRLLWQRAVLPARVARSSDLLFAPGGGGAGAARFAGRPVVVMCRNMLPFEVGERVRYGLSPVGLRLRLLALAQHRALRHADGVIFLSEYARATAMRRADALARWTIIPHGIGPGFRCPPRPQQPIAAYTGDRPFRLLYVSIVDLYKHQWHVVEAVAAVRAAGLPVAIDLVGPAYPPALRRLQETLRRLDPPGAWARYRGPVPHPDLAETYRQADGFVFASSCENLPNILMEAMSAGLPIASSNRGPMPELLGDAGVYFDPEEPSDLAAALERLLKDPGLRADLAARAFERAGAYSWERCATETFAFLAEIARRARRRAA